MDFIMQPVEVEEDMQPDLLVPVDKVAAVVVVATPPQVELVDVMMVLQVGPILVELLELTQDQVEVDLLIPPHQEEQVVPALL
jgi:hypothetical protein